MPASQSNLRSWRLADRREPLIRIGVILAEDAAHVIELETPESPRRAQPLPVGAAPDADGAGAFRLAPHSRVRIEMADGGLTVRVNAGAPTQAPRLRIAPVGAAPLARGAGVLVHDVVAGRGFHWQRRIDQWLPGTLDVQPGAGGLVLVNELGLEDYLTGVVTAEMSSACPLEYLKAQCIVARAWLLALAEPKHLDAPFERCNDDCCQRYQGSAELNPVALQAVQATRGVVLLTPGGAVLDANYAKSCGGVSETPLCVWGLEKPGVTAVVDAPPDAPERRFYPLQEAQLDEYLDGAWLQTTRCYCSPNVVPLDAIGRYLGRVDTVDDYFRWTVRYTRAELEELLHARLADAAQLVELTDLRVRGRGVSGRAYSVETEWRNAGGAREVRRLDTEYVIRQALHRKFLYSSAFAVRPERAADGRLARVTLRGAGWGHGVGLCQIGGLGMALCGITGEAICRHYYPTARLAPAY